jgi:uncharacterized protein (DUF885 family)
MLKSILLLTTILAATASFSAASFAADKKVERAAKIATADQGKLLSALFTVSDEEDLKLSPISALFRGDVRYADQFGDYITDEYLAINKAKAERELAALLKIDRKQLTPKQKIAYDVFQYQTEFGLQGSALGLSQISQQMPIDHFNGAHVFFPDLSSGQSAAQFKTVLDYENNLKRIDGFVLFLKRAQEKMQLGIANGHVQPKIVTANVIGQLDTLAKLGIDKSPYMMPVQNFPKEFSEADKARLLTAYRSTMATKILPAYVGLKTFMEKEYLPASRSEKPGLISMKDGEKVYKYLIQQHTTTKMTADEVHNLGLSEVARILKNMNAVKDQTGFKGDLKAFFEFIRNDPQFKFKTKEDLIKGYFAINERLKPVLATAFNMKPKSPLDIRPVPEFLEKNQAGAYYQQGTPDGSRPGVFYVNTYDLPSRTSPGMETLFLHEAVPGHHYQISLAQEDESLPPFMRFGGNTAYVEGWALYSESIGEELGFFKDPYQMQGHLDDEMLRAMRLVVDTGLHAKGWTREQAIKYMLDNSSMGVTDATSEVERYIAMPGQALAYKIGQLKIRSLRTEAEKALGKKFNLPAFHDQVLGTGALPLAVLETKIRSWIKTQK